MADQGHKLTDEALEALEKRLYEEYEQAAKETQEKLDKYMKKFTTKDAIWKKSVEAGLKTQEEYDKWRLQAIAAGERWEKMKDRIVADQLHVNQIAREIMDNEMPSIFELNANFALYQVEHDAQIDTSLTLYNREAVGQILRDDPDLLLPPGRRVSQQIQEGKAKRWERQKIQSVMTQGILQGESIPKLASRLASAVADSDYKAAVRNARTMATNAQNAGRYDAYNRLTNNGVELTLEWAATLDNRTRHEHRMMHGQRRNVGEPFEVSGVKIMYPAQTGSFMGISNLPQELLWNCRCTLLAFVKGYEHDTIKHSDKMGKMTFEEWLEAKPKPQDILHQKNRGDELEQDYIKGYRKMSKEADEILKNRSTVVNGQDITGTWKRRKDKFDFEIEDVINAQGFDGKPRIMSRTEFDKAVKAANGGNGFIAQRTYSAPDQETLDAYRQQLYGGKWYVDCSTGGAVFGKGMYTSSDYTGTLSASIKMDMKHYMDIGESRFETHFDAGEARDRRYKMADDQGNAVIKNGGTMQEARAAYDKIMGMDEREWAEKYAPDLLPSKGVSYVETMTLDPSAKIVTHKEMDSMRSYSGIQEHLIQSAEIDDDQRAELYQVLVENEDDSSAISDSALRKIAEGIEKKSDEMMNSDIGTLAAMYGYDAIHADGYTVILNRTKVIFLRED